MTRLLVVMLLPGMVAAAPIPAPRPGEVKIFRDWAVGCDNGKTCTLASLGSGSGSLPTITMNVTIAAGPAREARIVLMPVGSGPPAAALRIDGKTYDGLTVSGRGNGVSSAKTAALLAALPNATSLAALDTNGKAAAISASGIAAALRYVDAAQGRAGTVSAFVAIGPKPAASVPPAPALPQLAEVSTDGRAALPTAPQIAALARSARCDEIPAAKAHTFALGPNRALVLVPCDAGAYNLSSAVFVITTGKPRPATFDAPVGFGAASIVPLVVNATYRDGVLTSTVRGRGLGDCGAWQRFVWDGAQFRLVEQATMPDCRGNSNFINTWRVRVVRRSEEQP